MAGEVPKTDQPVPVTADCARFKKGNQQVNRELTKARPAPVQVPRTVLQEDS